MDINELCKVIKKYGIGLCLFIFFLWHYNSLNEERKQIQDTFVKTTNETVVVLIKMEDRLSKLENDFNEHNKELREVRYELRCISNDIGKPPKRFINE